MFLNRFNRTIVELKCVIMLLEIMFLNRFNRTIVELKLSLKPNP